MSTIHELSSVATLPLYDMFAVHPTQLIVESNIQTEHRPISTISDSNSPIEFEIHTGIDEYIDLSKSELKLCIRVKLSETNMNKLDVAVTTDNRKKIAPVNYLMHSMFKQIQVSIGQTSITCSSLNYAYVSYIDALINASPAVKKTFTVVVLA